MSAPKIWVYYFGEEVNRNLLGGKGANLSVMSRLGLPVPTGLTVSTEACIAYQSGGLAVGKCAFRMDSTCRCRTQCHLV